MEDMKSILAKNITALRQSRKMTQLDLAEKLSRVTIYSLDILFFLFGTSLLFHVQF